MIKKIVFLLFIALLPACMGVQSYYNPQTGRAQVADWENSAVNTSSKKKDYYQCPRGATEKEFLEGKLDCELTLTTHSDTSGVLSSVGSSALAGTVPALILKDSFGNTNNMNNSNDVGVSTNTNNNNINLNANVNAPCQGNCN